MQKNIIIKHLIFILLCLLISSCGGAGEPENQPDVDSTDNINTSADVNAEDERQKREKAEKEQKEREQAEKERLAREQAEKERLAREEAERERLKQEQAKKERLMALTVRVKRLPVSWTELAPIEWKTSDEKKLTDKNLIKSFQIGEPFLKFMNLLEQQNIPEDTQCLIYERPTSKSDKGLCLKYKHQYMVYRLHPKKANVATFNSWETMIYKSPLDLPKGKVVKLQKNIFMITRVLTDPLPLAATPINVNDPIFHKSTIDFEKLAWENRSKFSDSTQPFNISPENNLRNKTQFIDALIGNIDDQEIFKQNNVGIGDSSFAGHFITPGASASLFQGGYSFEPYFFSFIKKENTWLSHPRGGILVEVPAKNMLGAGRGDYYTPWPKNFYIRPSQTEFANEMLPYNWGKTLLIRDFTQTPDSISNLGVYQRTQKESLQWNEIFYAPVVVNSSGTLSSAKITGIFVYTPEDDWTKWPPRLQVFYKLAELNQLPVVIIWNE